MQNQTLMKILNCDFYKASYEPAHWDTTCKNELHSYSNETIHFKSSFLLMFTNMTSRKHVSEKSIIYNEWSSVVKSMGTMHCYNSQLSFREQITCSLNYNIIKSDDYLTSSCVWKLYFFVFSLSKIHNQSTINATTKSTMKEFHIVYLLTVIQQLLLQ